MDFETGPFTEAEKAALAFARQLTLDATNLDDALFARLQKHYGDGEVVEITAMAGLFNYLNRASEVFKVSPTKPGEGLE
jgi:alkylhydroperoxidase family enzyme